MQAPKRIRTWGILLLLTTFAGGIIFYQLGAALLFSMSGSALTIVGYSTTAAPPLQPTQKLREWGFKACPWMARPYEARYPRKVPVYHNGAGRGLRTSQYNKMYECVQRLTKLTEEGRVLFWLAGGQSLSAQTSGVGNRKGDDQDVDVGLDHSFAQFHRSSDADAFAKWACPETKLEPHFAFRFFPDEATEEGGGGGLGNGRFDKHARSMANPVTPVHEAVSVPCVDDSWSTFCDDIPRDHTPASFCRGEWEGIEVLLTVRWKHADLRHSDFIPDFFGPSYWIPLKSGGKHLGIYFPQFFVPEDGKGWSSLFAWPEWLEASVRGLQLMDVDGRGDITMREFSDFVVASPQINKQWLSDTVASSPCVVANAQIHVNHTLFFAQRGLALRALCGIPCGWRDKCETLHPDAWQCHKAASRKLALRWEDVEYFYDSAICASRLAADGWLPRNSFVRSDDGVPG